MENSEVDESGPMTTLLLLPLFRQNFSPITL
jgi:hypothetical protein